MKKEKYPTPHDKNNAENKTPTTDTPIDITTTSAPFPEGLAPAAVPVPLAPALFDPPAPAVALAPAPLAPAVTLPNAANTLALVYCTQLLDAGTLAVYGIL